MRCLLPRRLITKLALVATFLLVTASLIVASVDAQPAPSHPAPASSSPEGMYAYYYLWWDTQHWQTTLGSNYPFGQSPLPLPATLDAGGCNPTSLYGGNIETDAPATLFTQDDPAQVTYDVQSAIAAGLTGFAVDWYGTGSATQTPSLRRRGPAARPAGPGGRSGPGRGARLPPVALLRGLVHRPDPGRHRRGPVLPDQPVRERPGLRSEQRGQAHLHLGRLLQVPPAGGGRHQRPVPVGLVLRRGVPVEPVERDGGPVLRRRQPLLVEPGPLEQQPELPTARRAGRHPPRRGEEVLRTPLPGVRPAAGRIRHLRPPGQRGHPPGPLRRQRHR